MLTVMTIIIALSDLESDEMPCKEVESTPTCLALEKTKRACSGARVYI